MIYEEGDFFLAHQDTEKEKGMFGTLTIGLPTEHTGGVLSIRFNGAEETVDFSEACNNYKLPFAAFYADCEHEVHPLKSGHRLVLTYNLIQLASENEEKIKGPEFRMQTYELTNTLFEIEHDIIRPIPILLDHQYTPGNFSLENLKNGDRPKADIILQAAKAAGYFAQPVLLTYYQSGMPYWDYDDDNDDLEMEEVYDESLSIEHWLTNEFPELGNYDLDLEDLVSAYKLTDADPIEKEAEGYMGNYGPSLDYWYHYGAVLIWPKKIHPLFLNDRPIAVKLKWLEYYYNQWDDRDQQNEAVVRSLIKSLRSFNKDDWHVRDLDFSIVVKVLRKLNDSGFVDRVASDLFFNIFESVKEEEWAGFLTQYDESQFKDLFNKVLCSNSLKTIRHFVKVLAIILQQSGSKYYDFINNQLQQLAQSIEHISTKNNKLWDTELRDLVRWLIAIDNELEVEEAIVNDISQGLFKERNRKFVNTIINELISLEGKDFGKLGEAIVEISYRDLKERVANEPIPPSNWTREVPKSRNYQDVWKILTPFLQSPTEKVFEYRQRQDLRREVEFAIDDVSIDLKYETIKKGSPHILRITKTEAAYLLKMKEWKEDVELMGSLEGCYYK